MEISKAKIGKSAYFSSVFRNLRSGVCFVTLNRIGRVLCPIKTMHKLCKDMAAVESTYKTDESAHFSCADGDSRISTDRTRSGLFFDSFK